MQCSRAKGLIVFIVGTATSKVVWPRFPHMYFYTTLYMVLKDTMTQSKEKPSSFSNLQIIIFSSAKLFVDNRTTIEASEK